jgi:hypothetical protein
MRRSTIKEESPVPSEIVAQALPLMIPIAFLHGIKVPSEYQGYKKKKVKDGYAKKGIALLLESPVYSTLVPLENGSMITIFNGHHRSRYAPEFGIHTVPNLVFPLEAVAAFTQLPVDDLIAKLQQWSNESIDKFSRSFARQNKFYRGPQLLPDVTSFSELQQLGMSQNQLGILSFAYLQSINTTERTHVEV